MVVMKTWGPALGVANSMQRQLWRLPFTWIWNVPWALYGAAIVCEHPKWLAPRGRYVEGKEYPALTSYAYTAIALCAALFAAAGILSYEFFDLPAAPAALSVSYFSPIIGFFTLWIGGVIRSLIFGQGNPLLWAINNGPSDGSTWIWLGIFYWWAREETAWGKNLGKLLVAWVVVYWVWRFTYTGVGRFLIYPVPAVWANFMRQITNFLPAGTIGTLPMLIAVDALIRATERGRKTAAAK